MVPVESSKSAIERGYVRLPVKLGLDLGTGNEDSKFKTNLLNDDFLTSIFFSFLMDIYIYFFF